MKKELTGVWLGRRPYAACFALQRELLELRKLGKIGDVVLCLEHDPVITLGRGARPEHLLATRESLSERGIDVEEADRGGEITLHAPGQLVAYPIVALAPERCDVRRYVRDLAATMRELIRPFGVDAGEMQGLIGSWVDGAQPGAWPGEQAARAPQKIGAIGVRLSRWVSMHGFALNLAPDLSLYRSIVPCGVTAYGVCSLASLGISPPAVRELAPLAHEILAQRLERVKAAYLDAGDAPLAELPGWLGARSG